MTMGRPPGDVPTYPNLALGVVLGRPGQDPGGTGSRLLAEVRRRGWPAGFLGADRGYTQALPERFHLPVRALGYSLVMDYKVTELGPPGQQPRGGHGRRRLLLPGHARGAGHRQR